MANPDQDFLLNPDLFASEVHFCLLSDGVRSHALRRLWKSAKGNSELERILEIKVAEFRRALREARLPTVWNLPLRMGEWLGEHYRFTPPREVLTTLAYVVFVLVAIDALKSRVPWSQLAYHLLMSDSTSKSRVTADSDLASLSLSPSRARSDTRSRVDDWLVSEMKQAAESADWQQSLSQSIKASFAELNGSEESKKLLQQTVQQWTESDDFKALLQTSILKATETPEFRQRLKAAMTDAVSSVETKAAMQNAVQIWFSSDESKKFVTAAILNAQDVKNPARVTAQAPKPPE